MRGTGATSAPALRAAATDRLFRWLLLGLLAPAGVLTGHCLVYAVAFPDPEARATILMDSGHMWWGLGTPVAAVLAVAAILLLVVRRLPRQDGRRLATPQLCTWLAPRLAATQLTAFAGIEVTERLAVGHTLDDLLHHGILGRGAVAQLLVSIVLTAAVWWLALTAQRLGGAIVKPRALPARELGAVIVGPQAVLPRHRPMRPVGARAPPLIS